MLKVTDADVQRMRDALFFEGPDVRRRLSRFWLLLVLAGVIATAGVVADSTATVIGAMIVAPLMVPILGTVVAVVIGDHRNVVRSLALVVAGTLTVVLVGYLLGLVVPTDVLAANNSQVAARVSPRLIDLIAALATGAVGSIALARDDISDTLPGVAIAISLVPPLAVVGLTLEAGATEEAWGALLLFATNVTAILASGLVVMALYGLSRLAGPDAVAPHRTRAMVLIVAALVVVTVPLAETSRRVAAESQEQDRITRAATDWADGADWVVRTVDPTDNGYLVRVEGSPPGPAPAELRRTLDDDGLGDVDVEVDMIPVQRLRL